MRKLKAARDRLRPFDRVTSHVPMLNPDTYRIDAKVRKEMARWAYAEIDRPEALRLVARHILLLSSTSVITTFPMFERVRRTEGCRQIEVILGASTELGIQSLPTKWAVLLADIARNHDRQEILCLISPLTRQRPPANVVDHPSFLRRQR